MTSSTQKPVPPKDALPPTRSGTAADRSIRHAAITAGAGLLVMSALAGFATFVALDGLVTPGNAAQTATDIIDSAGLFRVGIASLFVVIALDVVVACGLTACSAIRLLGDAVAVAVAADAPSLPRVGS